MFLRSEEAVSAATCAAAQSLDAAFATLITKKVLAPQIKHHISLFRK